MLIDGNKRFVAGNLTSLGNLAQRRAQLVNSQSPFAVIVCCSDSRVPPELVFDQALCQLFVIRTAGQVIDEAAFSASSMGPRSVALRPGPHRMWRRSRGPRGAHGHRDSGVRLPFCRRNRSPVQRVLNQPRDQLDNAVRANMTMGVEQLRTSQPVLAGAVRGGQLTVAGGYYDLASGEVSILA